MFIRSKLDRRGRRHHQLVRTVRAGQTVRQEVLAHLGQLATVEAALGRWPVEVTQLRQRAAKLRSEAEHLRATMPPGWVRDGAVPRPSRSGMRLAQRRFSAYWLTRTAAEKLDRAASRLERRLDRLRSLVKQPVGTTRPADDEPLDQGA